MDTNSGSDKENDYKTIKDSRGEIKVYSSPQKNAPVKNTPQQTMEPEKPKKQHSALSMRFVATSVKIIGCWLPLAIVIVFIVFLATKPPAVWDTAVDFVNNNVAVPENEVLTETETINQINSQLTTVGENTVQINESQLAAILKPRLQQLSGLKVDLEEGVIRLVWVLDESREGKPVYGIIELTKDGEGLKIENIGTGRVFIPQSLNKVISDSLLSLSQIGTPSEADNLMQAILPFDESLDVTSLAIKEDLLELDVNLDASVFQPSND